MSVPIVGQPFELGPWCFTIVLRCTACPDRPPVLLTGGSPGQCPICRKVFALQSLVLDGRAVPFAAIGFAIASGHLPDDEEPES